MSSSEDEGDSWSEPWNPDDAKTSTFSSPNKEKASTSSRPDDKKSSSTSSFSSARPGSSVINTRMGLNDNKAGMEGLDKERINAIIYEASKGSKYYENEQRKDAETERRISKQKCIAEKLSSRDLLSAGQKADAILLELEGTRDLSHSIVHIDMDMFYAAVEMRDNPSLKDKPMAVGGNNMLSTSNYVARRYGVRAAMPGFIAKKLCPQLVIVPLSFRKYSAVSKEVQKVLSQYDPDFGAMSLDEAYLDFTPHITMRQRISQEFRRYPKTCDWARDCSCSQGDREIHKSRNEVKSKDDNDNDEAIGLKDNVDGVDRKGDEDQSKGDEVESKGDEDQSKGTEDESKGTEDESKGTEDESEGDEVHGQDDVDKIMCSLCGKCQQTVDEWEEFGVDIEEAVREMRHRIFLNTGLTASAGIAPNTMLAKICSDQNKPNGQCYIVPEIEAVKQFVKTLPIRKVCGIGKVSAQMLSAIDVKVCEDLYKQRAVLYHLYSLHSFTYYMRICLGLGSTQVSSDRQRKSISVERTFQEISKTADQLQKCEDLCTSLVEDMQDEHVVGKTVTLKLKTSSFEVLTRAHTLKEFTDQHAKIFSAAKSLLETEIAAVTPKKLQLRLMGVRMSNLMDREELVKDKEKQMSIDTMFKSVVSKQESRTSCKEVSTGYNCPVCQEKTTCQNLMEFNEHLDYCMAVSASCVSEKKPSSSELLVCSSSENTKACENPNDIADQKQVSLSAAVAATAVEEGNCTATCPICSHVLPNLDKLNSHLDTCLSKEAIKQCQQQSNSGEGGSKPSKRKRTGDKERSSIVKYLKKGN